MRDGLVNGDMRDGPCTMRTFNSMYHVFCDGSARYSAIALCVSLVIEQVSDFRVCQRPGVPCFIPFRVISGGMSIMIEDVAHKSGFLDEFIY